MSWVAAIAQAVLLRSCRGARTCEGSHDTRGLDAGGLAAPGGLDLFPDRQ